MNDPQYPQYPGTTLPIDPKRGKRRILNKKILLIAGFVVTFGAGIGIGAAAGGSSAADANLAAPAPEMTITQAVPGPTITVTGSAAAVVKPTPTPKPKPVKAVIADGDSVVVGSDVPPGRYDAHSDSTDCYYEIDKHATSDIVDNGGFHTGHLVITLKRGEDFSSDSCGDWTQE